jgi:hypothetical protein
MGYQDMKRISGARMLGSLLSLSTSTPERLSVALTEWRAPTWGDIGRVLAWLFRNEWAFIGLLVFCYSFFLTPAGTNTTSRYDMVYALTHGTAVIDNLAYNTIDVSLYQGHYYSPRSLGLSLLGVPVLWVLSLFRNIDDLSANTLTTQIALLSSFTVLPVAVAVAVAVRRFAMRIRPRLAHTALPMVIAGAFALATLAFPFATTFFSHAFGGGLAFLGFYLLFRARTHPRPWIWAATSGLFVGFAVISEYPVGVILVVLAAYIWLVFPGRRMQMLLAFAGGIVPSVLVLGWYNWFAFGSPFHLSYAYVADDAFAGQHQGFFGITYPQLDNLWTTLVYPRGILLSSPFLVLVPLGLIRWLRSQRQPATIRRERLSFLRGWLRHDYTQGNAAEALVCLAITVFYPLAIASYFLPMAGENLPGPRLLVPMLPFACLSLIWVVDDARLWLRRLFGASLVFAVTLSFIFVVLGVRVDHSYGAFPILDLYLPVLRTGVVPGLNGPTPPNLGQLWFHIPHRLSIWILAVPLAIWLVIAVRTLLAGAVRYPRGRPRLLSGPRPGARHDDTPTPEMISTGR